MLSRALTAILLLLVPAQAWAWGDQAHVFIAEAAYNLLQSQCLADFYYANSQQLLQSALDPDDWRDTDPDEAPRHFLDIDAVPIPANYPHDLNVAIMMYGRDPIYANGTVPWVSEAYYSALVSAFQARNVAQAVALSGNLSHYVSDSFSPYHATINFDGQATNNPGIHGRYEADMVDQNAAAVRMGINTRATRIPAPAVLRESIFDALEVGTTLVAAINAVDVRSGGSIPSLWSAKGAEAMDRMASGASLTHALWEAAYAQAGSPRLAGMSAGCAGTPDAGVPPPPRDAGLAPPPPTDAGFLPPPDAGLPPPDAGLVEPPDAGLVEPSDAGALAPDVGGMPPADAGQAQPLDGGLSEADGGEGADAGQPEPGADAMTPAEDAGVIAADARAGGGGGGGNASRGSSSCRDVGGAEGLWFALAVGLLSAVRRLGGARKLRSDR
jgi:hypothetical protein